MTAPSETTNHHEALPPCLSCPTRSHPSRSLTAPLRANRACLGKIRRLPAHRRERFRPTPARRRPIHGAQKTVLPTRGRVDALFAWKCPPAGKLGGLTPEREGSSRR